MNPDLVASRCLDRCNHFGCKREADCRSEKRRRDVLLIKELQDPSEPDAGTVLPLRESSDVGIAIAQPDRLVIDVKGQQHRYPGTARPVVRRQIATSPDLVDCMLDTLLGPFPWRMFLLCQRWMAQKS